jgi:hypothetical protein
VFNDFTSSGCTCVKPDFLFPFSGIEVQHATAGLYYESGGVMVLLYISMFCYKVHKGHSHLHLNNFPVENQLT